MWRITLSPLAVNFEDRWWPLQTIWIQMKPHKMWGFIWDPNCLTFRLYISKKMGGNNECFENFERNKYLKKLPSMQRVNQFSISCVWVGISSLLYTKLCLSSLKLLFPNAHIKHWMLQQILKCIWLEVFQEYKAITALLQSGFDLN